MTKYFNDVGFPSQAGNDKSQFVKDLHIAKTVISCLISFSGGGTMIVHVI